MERSTTLTTKNTYSLLHKITTDKHGLPPTKRLFRVTKLDPIPEFICPWGRFGGPGQPIVGSSLFSLYRSKSSYRHDHEVHLVHLVELYGDHLRSQGQSLHASRPSRLCARAQSVDDMPFRTRACMGYTR
ncbi:hypothetical protein Tco_0048913 [Tanacetum coccineum]